jgi:hypothetical protein
VSWHSVVAKAAKSLNEWLKSAPFGATSIKLFEALNHRDKTKVQMLAKIFPHLKVKS